MSYDKKLLESWANMEDWGSYVIRNGGLNDYSSKEGFDFLSGEYFSEVKRRIEYCRKMLRDHEDAFLNYTLAELYDRCNEDESHIFLFKWPVKYYCHRALEIDPDFALVRELLQKVDNWLKFLSEDPWGTTQDLDIDFWQR